MGKQYLRYIPRLTFGVVTSHRSNALYDSTGQLAVVPSLECVHVWDIKKGIKVGTLSDPDVKSEVTALAISADGLILAAGYSDGSVRIWNLKTHNLSLVFHGHKNEVTALYFDSIGARLVSGAKDTDLVVWDLLNETGLFRLRGHRNQITGVVFVPEKECVISVSKDTLLKVWDLTTQHCVQTIVAHRSEVSALMIDNFRGWLVTGSEDADLKLWKINAALLDQVTELEDATPEVVSPLGSIERSTKERVTQISIHSSGNLLACLGGDKAVELFRIRTEEEIKKKITRRLRRLQKKQQLPEGIDAEALQPALQESVQGSDRIGSYQVLRTQVKIRSFALHPKEHSKSGRLPVMVGLANNSVEVHAVPLPSRESDLETECVHCLDLPGHRSEIRAVSLSSDDELVASCSKGLLKIWNVQTGSCLRTMECGVAICCTFLPGDRHVLVGTKTGELELFDVASSSLIERFSAHLGTVWSIDVQPDKNGIVTGSADKEVKFWDLDTKTTTAEDGTGQITRQLTLAHVRTLQMTDDVLCVKYSPNQNLLAVSLLDTTVKVFYSDSLKLFLSLYGHKLPVLSLDISSDNHMIVTGSADKNIKLWGLEFGDCHKSLFAHQESVMQVRFVPNTHYFFSVSKDKFIKYWDGDKFENIMKLDGHLGEIWGLAVSKFGSFIVTGSHDRSIRVWERSDEPLFLEEEREKELETLFESTLVNSARPGDSNEDGEVKADEVSRANTQTMESLKAGERIFEALAIADREKSELEEYNKSVQLGQPAIPPPSHPILAALNVSADRYVLNIVRQVKPAELEDALLTLPLAQVISLLSYLALWAEKVWNTPLLTRILAFVLKVYHPQITTSRVLRPTLESIRHHLRKNLQRQKDTLGFNLAGLQFLQRESSANPDFFDPTVPEVEEPVSSTVKRKLVA